MKYVILPLVLATACTDSKDGDTSSTGNNESGWMAMSHPCVGNRTDVMWFDDANTGYVGCGSTTSGYGIFKTSDGGSSWASASTLLDSMRVNSIHRADDGNLYVGGTGDNGIRVVYLDPSDAASEYYIKPDSGAQSWQTFQVGTFRMDGNGRAVSESLTGSDVMYWPSTGAEAISGYGWWNETIIGSAGAQILDMEIHNNQFYGVGSTINQPPYFYYENGMTADAFGFGAVNLAGEGLSAFEGEVWDIAIDNSGDFLLAGVNEGTDVGVLWYNTGDITTTDGWKMLDITPITPDIPNNATRFYGACRSGNLMVAVGDFSQLSEAIVVMSTDGGTNWSFHTPDAGPLSKCQIIGSDIYITGADGLFAIMDSTAY